MTNQNELELEHRKILSMGAERGLKAAIPIDVEPSMHGYFPWEVSYVRATGSANISDPVVDLKNGD